VAIKIRLQFLLQTITPRLWAELKTFRRKESSNLNMGVTERWQSLQETSNVVLLPEISVFEQFRPVYHWL
jgi:hypothetical protein